MSSFDDETEKPLSEVFPRLSSCTDDSLGMRLALDCQDALCPTCPRRPVAVCICSCFPEEAVPIQSRIIILQHPNEVTSVRLVPRPSLLEILRSKTGDGESLGVRLTSLL